MATISSSNTKQRITVAVANALGKFAPLFIILKHYKISEESPDQTSMTVVQEIHRRNKGFGIANDRRLHVWSRVLSMKNKKREDYTAEHKCGISTRMKQAMSLHPNVKRGWIQFEWRWWLTWYGNQLIYSTGVCWYGLTTAVATRLQR